MREEQEKQAQLEEQKDVQKAQEKKADRAHGVCHASLAPQTE